MAKTPVLLDTNILMLYGQGVDVLMLIEELLDEPHEFLVPGAVLAELAKLASGAGKDARAAKLALSIAKAKALKTVPSSGDYADDAILAFAEGDPKSIVCTLDAQLRSRLGVRVLGVQGKKLMISKTRTASRPTRPTTRGA